MTHHMKPIPDVVKSMADSSMARSGLWSNFIKAQEIAHMAEVGVYRGHFAEAVLRDCESLSTYYMIDPWRSLTNWNKPANVSDDKFERYLEETKSRTDFAAEKRVILRGRTTEVIDEIPNKRLDFAYIDADHTLKGITVDLLNVYPKVRPRGWIGGDDFSRTIWQHDTQFEPTLVFPYAVYFAEAVDSPIFGLPNQQFLIHKNSNESFRFVDLTDKYDDLSLRDQLKPNRILKRQLSELINWIRKAARKLR